MPKYCQEKFEETTNGTEIKVCWICTKHDHNPAMITDIEIKLGVKYGGNWAVRINSYESNKSSCSTGAEDYGDL